MLSALARLSLQTVDLCILVVVPLAQVRLQRQPELLYIQVAVLPVQVLLYHLLQLLAMLVGLQVRLYLLQLLLVIQAELRVQQ